MCRSNLQKAFFALAVCLAALLAPNAFAQTQDEDTARRFWPPNFRPPAAKPSKPKPVAIRYRRTSPALSETVAANDSVLGITIWLVTPPAANNPKEQESERILVPKTGKKTNLIAKRVEASTKFSPGQKVRLSLEVPRSGFLYVIDREQYEDGSFSDPYLIYPLDPVADDNRVSKGRVIEIPKVGEDPYFEVQPLDTAGKSRQVAELLTVLVTPTPLKELPKATRNAEGDYEPILLPRAQVEEWEKQWATQVEQAELEGGAGQLYSSRELAAGTRKQRLTNADPLPQTVFRVAAKPGRPLLVKLPLNVGK